MDRDALQREVDEWVREDIITEDQAAAILSRYDDTGSDRSRSRAVLALTAVGAALVFAGITLFLATNWNELPTAAQVLVLLAGPGSAYAGGAFAYRRRIRRAGLALSLLGVVLSGPSLFLLADIAPVDIAETWVLLAWTAVALSTGHALRSRVGIGVGLVLLAALLVDIADPSDPMPIVALSGVVLFALSNRYEGRIGWTYRTVGVGFVLFGLLALTTLDGRYHRFEIEVTATFIALSIAALAATAWMWTRGETHASGTSTVALVAVGIGTAIAALAPETVPEAAAFVGVHLTALVAIGSIGYFGYRTGSRTFVDLAALGALAQTLSFVAATIVDSLSGSIALVVAGIVLLSVGIALERGRRSILDRLGADE